MPENFHFSDSLLNKSVSAEIGSNDLSAEGSAAVDVGRINLDAQLDPEHLRAAAEAEARTVDVTAEGDVHTPVGDVQGDAHADGPSVGATGEVSPDGVDATIGADAGSVGASVGVDALGHSWHVGGELGLKAELGVHLGATSRIDLPLISLEGPTVPAAIVSDAIDAAKDLAADPVGTVDNAVNTASRLPEDAVDAAQDVVNDALDGLGLSGDSSNEEHVATTTDFGGSSTPVPKGSVRLD